MSLPLTEERLAYMAGLFADYVHDSMSARAYEKVKALNATPEFASDDTCASHTYCDANVCMARAFLHTVGEPVDVTNDQHVATWNAAWVMAKRGWMTAGTPT